MEPCLTFHAGSEKRPVPRDQCVAPKAVTSPARLSRHVLKAGCLRPCGLGAADSVGGLLGHVFIRLSRGMCTFACGITSECLVNRRPR